MTNSLKTSKILEEHYKSFSDSLNAVAAESAKCGKFWSEGLYDGQLIRDVRSENPLINLP